MNRVEEAANALYKYFNRRFYIKKVLMDIKEDEKSNGFHFGTGSALRDTLTELGYADVKDNYLEILNLLYKRVGIK